MRAYYLFDGNEVKEVTVATGDEIGTKKSLDCFSPYFEEAENVEDAWLRLIVIPIDLEGEIKAKDNVLYTISINNRPHRAIINPDKDKYAEIVDYVCDNNGDYRICTLTKESMEG